VNLVQTRNNWVIIGALVIGLMLIGGSATLLGAPWWERGDLSTAICQAGDLGERYFPRPAGRPVTGSYLGEEVVDYHAITLEDLSLTYTVLNCEIIGYEDEAAARQAFQRGCDPHSTLEAPDVGDEACHFASSAPHTLAFRRDRFLVRMSGDVTSLPAQAVDSRLK
jgi:hypothetical protein